MDVHDIVEATPVQDWTVPLMIAVAGEIDHGKSTVAKMISAKFGHHEIAFADHLRHVCQVMFGIPSNYLTDRELKNIPFVGVHPEYHWPFDVTDPRAIERHIDVMLGEAYFMDSTVFTNAASTASTRISPIKIGANQLSPNEVRRNLVTQFMRHIWVPLRNGHSFTPREIMQLMGTEVFRAVDPAMWIWAWKQQVGAPPNAVAPDLRFPNEVAAVEALNGVCIKVVRPGHRGTQRVVHMSDTVLNKHTFDYTLVNDGTVEDLWGALQQALHIYAKTHIDAVDSGYAKLVTA